MTAVDHFARTSRVIANRPDDLRDARPPSCFVAVGDSFTAGTGCAPDEAWADRLAAGLRARGGGLSYRNLAVDGATSAEVAEQVGCAIELEPDLVTIVCGANDALRSPRPNPAAYATRLQSMFRRLRAAGPEVRIVTATIPERWAFLPLGPRTQARVERAACRINAITRRVATLNQLPYLEVAGHSGLSQRDNFAEDGLHPSPLGHRRVARAFADLLEARLGITAEVDSA